MHAAKGLDDRQRSLRSDRVPASWAATAMGEDPSRTYADLWHLWSGREPAVPVDQARNGLALEPAIARLAEDQYAWRLRAVRRTFVLGDLAASPDCWLLNEPAFVELKAYGAFLGNILPRWRWQAIGQLAVRPDIERVEVVALSGASLHRWTIERSEVAAAIHALHGRATELRAMFAIGDPPPRDDRDDASDVLTFAPLLPGEVLAAGELAEVGNALADVVAMRKASEAAQERLRAQLARVMADDAVTAVRGPSWAAVARRGRSGRTLLVFTTTEAPMG